MNFVSVSNELIQKYYKLSEEMIDNRRTQKVLEALQKLKCIHCECVTMKPSDLICKVCERICCAECFDSWSRSLQASVYQFPCLCKSPYGGRGDLYQSVGNRFESLKKAFRFRCPYEKYYNENYDKNRPPNAKNQCEVKVSYDDFYNSRNKKSGVTMRGHLSECVYEPFKCEQCDLILCFKNMWRHRDMCLITSKPGNKPVCMVGTKPVSVSVIAPVNVPGGVTGSKPHGNELVIKQQQVDEIDLTLEINHSQPNQFAVNIEPTQLPHTESLLQILMSDDEQVQVKQQQKGASRDDAIVID